MTKSRRQLRAKKIGGGGDGGGATGAGFHVHEIVSSPKTVRSIRQLSIRKAIARKLCLWKQHKLQHTNMLITDVSNATGF
jgi:hypothetical protein